MACEIYLIHHGIGGQKWGVRHGPPYPLGKGGIKKRPNIVKSMLAKRKEKKAEKAEREKQKVLSSGSASDVLKMRDKLTDDELRRASERIKNVQNLEKLEDSEASILFDRIDNWAGRANQVNKNINSAIDIVNTIDKANNLYKKYKMRDFNKAKERIIKSGNPDLVFRNSGVLNNSEFESAFKRINSEKALERMVKHIP